MNQRYRIQLNERAVDLKVFLLMASELFQEQFVAERSNKNAVDTRVPHEKCCKIGDSGGNSVMFGFFTASRHLPQAS